MRALLPPWIHLKEMIKQDDAGTCIKIITDAVRIAGATPPKTISEMEVKRNLSSQRHHHICRFLMQCAERSVGGLDSAGQQHWRQENTARACLFLLARRLAPWLPCRTSPEMWSRPRRPNRLFWVQAFVSRSGAMVHSCTAAASTHEACPLDEGQGPRHPRDLEIGYVVGTRWRPWPPRSCSLEIFGARLQPFLIG